MKEKYKDTIEKALGKTETLLDEDYFLSKRTIASLLLQEDEEIKQMVKEKEPDKLAEIEKIIEKVKKHFTNPINYEMAIERQNKVNDIIENVVEEKEKEISFRERMSRLMMNPFTGIPILLFVLYWGLYKFVGVFGAGTVVDYLEIEIFEKMINPYLRDIFLSVIPWPVIQNLFVGKYGVLTLGFRYAAAIILPIVTFFFIVFSIIEDSGYLPRLAMLIDRTFKKIGLSGRAVIPMVLGFGCDTMATMVTRTLPTKRERVISTMLLALAVPCSAQLGVILALLSGSLKGLVVWAGIIGLIFLFIGYLTAKVLPGKKTSFYMELPPLRWPKITNVLTKTYIRVKWYFKEVLPLFLLASIFIWLGQVTGLFKIIINLLEKPVNLIGLPDESAKIFLFGFFRRDYGAAGLYDINKQGILSTRQLVVACVALTLFLPCIAQFLMTVKERGWKTGLGISFFILFFSFGVAYVVNLILTNFHILT